MQCNQIHSRRRFIQSTAGVLGALSVGSLSAFGRTPQDELPVLRPAIGDTGSSLGDTTLLEASIEQFDVGEGQMSWGYTYNQSFPGPALEANYGDNVFIRFQNMLEQPSTIHWHGMVVPHAVDGHPADLVFPNEAFIYRFPIVQRACLNWYHPHPHELTGEQVNLGLAGAFIIRDEEESLLDLPFGTYEVPLIIRDAKFDNDGNLKYNPPASGFYGDVPLVNGKQNASMSIDTEVYRFRVLNGANARVFRISLSNGAPFTIIGNDGGLLEFPVSVNEIEFGPGERLDLLVDFRELSVGNEVTLMDLDENWDLIEFTVVNAVEPQFSIPGPNDQLSVITPLANPQDVREFSFEGHSKINGLEYDIDRIDFEVPFAQTELWRFITGGNGPHPVHVHGASFQVVSRSGGRNMLFPWESGWKDTVLVGDGETVEVLTRFDVYSDQIYLLHCHLLEHEDNGMMSNFRVLPQP